MNQDASAMDVSYALDNSFVTMVPKQDVSRLDEDFADEVPFKNETQKVTKNVPKSEPMPK